MGCGGGDGDDEPLSSVERFDPNRNRWERLAAMTHERSLSRGVEIDRRLFICGGIGLDQLPLSSAEWFDQGSPTSCRGLLIFCFLKPSHDTMNRYSHASCRDGWCAPLQPHFARHLKRASFWVKAGQFVGWQR